EEIHRGVRAYVVRGDVEFLQGELSAAAVPGGDLPAGEVPGVDDPRPRGSVVDARHAQRHLALAGTRPDAGDGAEGGPLGSLRRRGPGDEAEGRLADAGVMKAVAAIWALSRPPPKPGAAAGRGLIRRSGGGSRSPAAAAELAVGQRRRLR